MAGLVPAIYVLNFARAKKAWMAGTSPAMTSNFLSSSGFHVISRLPARPDRRPRHARDRRRKLATAAAGIRYKGRTDVLLAVMDKGTTVAGVFTQSKCPSAPVEWCRAKLAGGGFQGGFARALVVNSGNANAFTGKTGRQATTLTARSPPRRSDAVPARCFSPPPA